MKTFKRLSIRTQVLLFGLFIVAIIPIIVSRVYQLSSETIINQNTQYNTELVSSSSNGFLTTMPTFLP